MCVSGQAKYIIYIQPTIGRTVLLEKKILSNPTRASVTRWKDDTPGGATCRTWLLYVKTGNLIKTPISVPPIKVPKQDLGQEHCQAPQESDPTVTWLSCVEVHLR